MAKRIEILEAPPNYPTKPLSLPQPRAPSNPRPSGAFQGTRANSQATNGGGAPNGVRNPRPFRSISNEEFRKHVATGTCFKCGLKFGPMHRCPPKTLQVLVGEEEVETEEEFNDAAEPSVEGKDEHVELQHLQLSELTSNGLDGFQTMKMFGYVCEKQIKVMVDSGASHCFITEEPARKLGLEVVSTAAFAVTLGDGSRVRSGGICLNVPLRLESHKFNISYYVFFLNNIDAILGVPWLPQLGEIKADWRKLVMRFTWEGQEVRLCGDPSITRRACSTRELRMLEEVEECWWLWEMGVNSDSVPEGHSQNATFSLPDPSEVRRQEDLKIIMAAYPEVTTPANRLPPHRSSDH